jgi:hypothetical protein
MCCGLSPLSKARSRGRETTPTTEMLTSHFKRPSSRTASPRASHSSDGNKRLALVAMLTFLEVNGYRVDATDPELASWIIDLSDELTPEGLAQLLRDRLIRA